jgi:hypothetical protein
MFDITPYIIDISVSVTPRGVDSLQLSNLALFTTDQFLSNIAGDDYRSYVSLAKVGSDFGTETETYKQAQAVFSQKKTILDGGGQLIIIPLLSGVSGYSGDSGVSGTHYESLDQAVVRAAALVSFYGIISTEYPSTTGEKTAYATAMQALSKLAVIPSSTLGDIAGAFTTIMEASEFKTRCLYYGGTALQARLFAAAYMSRLLSVDFTGSNTTLTMHLKELVGIDPDESLTDTILSDCEAAGVDVYGDFAGTGCVFTSGENLFVDQVYNMTWLNNQLQVNGFNVLRTTNGKLPQTEPGMSVLIAAYSKALSQAVQNGYLAPGVWNSTEVFGNPTDFAQNINQRGFYLYHAPISSQSTQDREDRKAPLIQIAAKESGALHSSSVIVNINP